MAGHEISIKLADSKYVKQMIADFTGLIEAVISKDVERSLEIAEGLARKYGEKKEERCVTCVDYSKCNEEYDPLRLACGDYVEKEGRRHEDH